MPGIMVRQPEQQGQSASDASAVKAELRKLMTEKDALEREIDERAARLNGPGGPGMEGSLVDKQGFPRADIDVHAARTDRHAIICLTNDHKAVSDKIGKLLAELHSLSRTDESTPSSPSKRPRTQGATAATGATPSPAAPAAAMDTDAHAAAPAVPVVAYRPFAVVDEVSPDSPASAAGIQLGDQLCRFGDVALGDPTVATASSSAGGSSGNGMLQAVAAELMAHEGRPVEAVFLRAGQPVTLVLTPQRWAGRGLLGCHLRPLR